jgi:hypothetical protein
MILEQFGITNITTQRFDRLVARLVHHLKDLRALPRRRGQKAGSQRVPRIDSDIGVKATMRGICREWRQIAPLLERRGLPTVDGLLGGRYTPAVKAFFDREYEIHGGSQVSSPHAPAELGSWKKKGRPA